MDKPVPSETTRRAFEVVAQELKAVKALALCPVVGEQTRKRQVAAELFRVHEYMQKIMPSIVAEHRADFEAMCAGVLQAGQELENELRLDRAMSREPANKTRH
ncbi:hypothetical protein [Caballeronia sp. dw_276]|uniref:hypothetical protein n=1 Tax=Caballeronia sp. dw_276 TaxID=2719795 RepID=UPI001BD4CB2D|nr:hypothetical protein [Caballeronia sp. dw_276]